MRCSFVITMLLASCLASVARADDEHFEKKVAADPHGTVEISNVTGKVDVIAWDNSEVEVRAELDGAEHVDVESDHGRTSIKVRSPGGVMPEPPEPPEPGEPARSPRPPAPPRAPHGFYGGGNADLVVHVPRNSEVSVTALSSDVRATDVAGPLRVRTVSGNVNADVFQNDVEVKTVSGSISLKGKGTGAGGQMRLQTISGGITVDHGSGSLEATTVSGDLKAALESTRNVRIHTTSGSGRLSAKLLKGAIVEAETVSGDLKVGAVPDGALEYEVNSFSGDIKNCMGLHAEKVSQYAPGMRLSGVTGKEGAGESRVRVKSMSGDVELCDKP
jgi:hypothetical protein